ncbi:phosphoenolpyruvate mutase [Scytonema sp. PCC 10023]|uniref:phosphoenolpyruvate mutase n=1 Tax=Scytonema sp. PCC 10023 TaxID=1680591 RepID=UPI0039C6DADA
MFTKATKLRKLFETPGIIRLVAAHNSLGAKIAERIGFDGVWSSSFEISTSHCVPDASILSMSEYLAVAESMNASTSIPIVADCDTGYGNLNNVIHMVRKFEAAGIAGVCIEDKQFPKINSFIPGRQELASVSEFMAKIMAAKNAQRSADFMVIARVEALIAGHGQKEALMRAQAYAEAGADAIVIHSKAMTPEPIAEFTSAWNYQVPLVVIPTTYYTITVRELEELGVKMVIYANHGIRAAISAMEKTFAEILRTGSSVNVEMNIASMKSAFELQGMYQLKHNEELYLRLSKQKIRTNEPDSNDWQQ